MVFYGQEDFQDWRRRPAEENFSAVLSRARLKELAHDYLERDQVNELCRPVTSAEHVIEQNTATPAAVMTVAERLRQRSDQVAQRLAAEREQERARETLEQQHTPEHRQRNTLEQEIAKQRELDHDQGLEL